MDVRKLAAARHAPFVPNTRKADLKRRPLRTSAAGGSRPGRAGAQIGAAQVTRLQRGMTLELRAEAFNLLNNPAFGNPHGVLGSAAFGSITTAGDPRVVQLAVKFGY
jgi:hypothetical protein